MALIFFTRFPPVYIDEMWHIDTARTFVKTGRLAVSAWGDFFGSNQINFRPPLFNFILGLWFKVFGWSLVSARLCMVAFSVPFLYFTYKAAAVLYDEAVAVVSIAIVYAWWFHTFRYVRYDMPTGALCVASFYFFLRSETSAHPSRAVLVAGLFSGLAPISHLYGAFMAPALALLFFIRRKSMASFWRDIAVYALGIGVPMLIFAAYFYIHRDLIFRGLMGFHGDRVDVFSPAFYWKNIKGEFLRWFPIPLASTFTVFIPSFLGFLILRRRELRNHLPILIPVAVFFIGFALLIQNKVSIYLAQAIPFLSIGAAVCWVDLMKKIPVGETAGRRLVQGVVVLLCLARPAQAVYLVVHKYGLEDSDFMRQVRWVRERIPTDAIVVGIYPYQLGFTDQTFYDENLIRRSKALYGISFEEAIRRRHITYLIVDGVMLHYQEDPSIETFLSQYCDLVASKRNKVYSSFDDLDATDETRIYHVKPEFYD